jgi:queuine/archaeosine tRNA-ribosyltransferase
LCWYTRAYLHHLVTKEPAAALLVTYHNIRYMMNLSKALHHAIVDGSFPEFVNKFLGRQFPAGDVPRWVREALAAAEVLTPNPNPKFQG